MIHRFAVMALLLASTVLTATAQPDTGMHFVHGQSWASIKARAKAEQKYIFMDAYTTWCGPCKYMTKNIFPQKAVGEFLNQHFINVKFQLDTAANDDAAAKAQYADAALIATQYKVRAYPTYLFFNPEGELVHRELGSSEAPAFIAKAANALDPEKQYYTLVRRYEAGEKSPEFLRKLSYAALNAYDEPNLKIYAAAYLATQTNLTSAENIAFLSKTTRSTSDPGFNVMLNNPAAFDAQLGKGTTETFLKRLITREKVMPMVAKAGDKPNWAALTTKLTEAYGPLGAEAVQQAKINYLRQNGEWQNFSAAVSAYIKAHNPNFSPDELNDFAWSIFENCEDAACVATAINWSKTAVDLTNNPMFIDTYANLLYKNKRKAEAIEWQTKAVAATKSAGEDASDYEKTLAKMKKGEKTW
jgi:thioredoxin-related protein